MRSRLALILAAGAVAAVPGSTAAANGPVAHIACKSATIAGAHKCIARGQFCKHSSRAMRDYRRYGLSCSKQDARGNWHLQ